VVKKNYLHVNTSYVTDIKVPTDLPTGRTNIYRHKMNQITLLFATKNNSVTT